jgi:hydroxymethylpyrimidine/phosphomethylpyrimidine kinase
MSAITALTAQNTVEVRGIFEVPPEFVALQIDAVVEDIGVDVIKTGMLTNSDIVEVVADRIRMHGIRSVVVDPVMLSKSFARLLTDDAITALKTCLLPCATIVTPNIQEAETLSGETIRGIDGMKRAAEKIKECGVGYVVVKGGHLSGEPVDLLFDGQEFREYRGERLVTSSTHGTGCVFAAAIATYLGKGMEVERAVGRAKSFVTETIRYGLGIGGGTGPVNVGYAVQ